MKFLRSTYLNDRFFYGMAICVLLFLVSYTFEWLFPVACIALGVVGLMLITEIFFLFQNKNVTAARTAPAVFSLHDKNEVKIFVSNKSDRPLRLRVIDELPHQFNIRNLVLETSIEPGEIKNLAYQLTPVIRGSYHFGDLQIFVRLFAGLVSRRETIPADRQIAVYPSLIQM